jgi:hypothetical protein
LGNISPLLVGFLPFLLDKGILQNLQFPKNLKQIVLVAAVTLLAWIAFFFTVLEIRYVLFLWIVMFLGAARIFEQIIHQVATGIRAVVRALVMILLTAVCIRTLMIAIITYFPYHPEEQPFCPDSNLCKYMETVNLSASPGERVFVLHAYRYYLRPDLFACSSRVDDYYELEDLARENSPEFWVELVKRGYHFIMYEEHLSVYRYHFGHLPALDTVPSWIMIKNLYTNRDNTQVIYEIEVTNPPVQPQIVCEQNATGTWQIIAAQP